MRTSRLALLLCVCSFSAHAQSVRVVLTEESSNTPIVGAVVALRTADTALTRAERLTDVRGEAVLTAEAAGAFRVYVRRIGFRPFTSEPFMLRGADTVRLALRIPAVAVVLPTVTSRAKPKACRRGEGEQLPSSTLWEQIQTALVASQLTSQDTSVRTFSRNVVRELGEYGQEQFVSSVNYFVGGGRPYFARSPADLSRLGYVAHDLPGSAGITIGEWVDNAAWFGPDVAVLLSPEFANDHCFSMVAGSGPTAGLSGLQFDPVSDRSVVDISGVLWVSARDAHLQFLDFSYVHLPGGADAEHAGGRIELEQLPDGHWIVDDWTVVAPRIAPPGRNDARLRPIAVGYAAGEGTTERVVIGKPIPDSVTRLAAGRPCADSAVPFRVSVAETPTGSPLAGATVEVAWFDSAGSGDGPRVARGTPLLVQVDSLGLASVCAPERDGVAVAVAHDEMNNSSGLVLHGPPTSPKEIDLLVSRESDLRAKALRTATLDAVVRDAHGAPLQGAIVRVGGIFDPATTDKGGRARVSGIQSGLVFVDVWRAGYARQRLAVAFGAKVTTHVDITLADER